MKIKISKTDLMKNIQAVQNIISSRSSLPILSNVLIEAEKSSVTLTSTDLDIGVSSTISADVEETGAITVPAKRFSDIIKELPEEDVLLGTLKNNSMTIKCGRCFFKILGLPKEDFPKLPEFKNQPYVAFEQAMLKNMLNMVFFAMSHDETRYVLNGSLFLFKDTDLTIVATDGKRLAYVKKDIAKDAPSKSIIVPSKTIYELNRILEDSGDMKITFSENQVRFELGNTTIISRLIEGEFPNYEQVIPKPAKENVSLQREQFLLGVRRSALLTTSDSQSIKIDITKGKMIISKSNPNIGEAKEELEIGYKGNDISVGFNPTYLADVLKVLPKDDMEIEILGPDKPALVRIEEWYVYMVLPMQLA